MLHLLKKPVNTGIPLNFLIAIIYCQTWILRTIAFKDDSKGDIQPHSLTLRGEVLSSKKGDCHLFPGVTKKGDCHLFVIRV